MTTEPTPPHAHAAPAPRRRVSTVDGPGIRTHWLRFAGIIMTIIGVFGILEGITALVDRYYFITGTYGTVFSINLAGWGWFHIIVGALVLIAGVALLGTEIPTWARVVGVAFVSVNMVLNLLWLPAAPLWAVIVIALDVFILFALVAAHREPVV